MERVFTICKKHQDTRVKLAREREQGKSHPPKRFILLPKPKVKDALGEAREEQILRAIEEQQAYYKEFHITPVWYPASGGDHSALRYALEELADLPTIPPTHGWGGG